MTEPTPRVVSDAQRAFELKLIERADKAERSLALKGLQAEAMREAIGRALEFHELPASIRAALKQALNERKET